MSNFWQMLVGPTPGERVNAEVGDWINGQPSAPSAPPSEIAVKLSRVIEASGDRWVFEDDQGHAHSYDLGITVSLGGDVVWQGSRDEHVRHTSTELMRTRCGTVDAIHIRDALQARRIRHAQALVEKKQREAEEARVAREKRAVDAIEKLSRGECLEDPFASPYGGLGELNRPSPMPDYIADYERIFRRRGTLSS